jgi:hypothetical protein
VRSPPEVVPGTGNQPTAPGAGVRIGRVLLRLRLFISSYAPLFLIMAVRTESRALGLACAVLAVTGVGSAMSILHATRSKGPGMVHVSRVRDRGAEVGVYLATYLLPFVTAADPSLREVIADVVYLLIAGVIYTSSNLLALNPTLYCLLLRVSTITTSRGDHLYVIAHRVPVVGSDLLVRWLADDVVVA